MHYDGAVSETDDNVLAGRSKMPTRRIAIGGVLTECNHLGGLPIDMATYEAGELFRGDAMLQLSRSVVGGMFHGLKTVKANPVPLIYASACSAGPMTHDCYQQIRTEFLTRLEEALPVDGVLLPLHGSALADGVDDPEGDLIHATRQLVGPEIPVIATLDLHAHVTAEMVQHADALLAWETYPHQDQYSTGLRGAQLLLDTLDGKCRPTMAMGKVPVITSAIHGSTNDDDPFADLMRYTKSLEDRADVLSSSLFLIHPYMDCANMGSGAVVVTDNDLELAAKLAADVAQRYWERRSDLEPDMLTPDEAICRGMQCKGGPVILVEAADCCGGGAVGDSIATLSALVDSNVDAMCIVPVVDPEAAQRCHESAIGAELTIPLGHKLDPRWGTSRDFTGIVDSLHEGEFVFTGGQWEGHREQMGPTAVFRIGSIRVMITSKATYDWADEPFRSVGLEPPQAKFIVAKNPMNFRFAYGEIAVGVMILDTPGPTPATLKHVRFQKLKRPYFPADIDVLNLQPVVLT